MPRIPTALLCAEHPSSIVLAWALEYATDLRFLLVETEQPANLPRPRPLPGRAAAWAYERLYHGRFRARAARQLAAVLPEAAFPPSLANLRVRDANSPEAREFLKDAEADVFVVWGTRILKPETYGIARRLAVNAHAGVLPQYRGGLSEFWALSEGHPELVGWTLHRMTEALDGGPVLHEGRIPVAPGEDEGDLRPRNLLALAQGLRELFARLEAGEVPERAQGEGPAPRRGYGPWTHARLHGRLHLWGLRRPSGSL